MHKCRSCGADKLNLLPFYHLTFKCDLDLPHTWINVSNGTATPQGEQLCQIILKSMHTTVGVMAGTSAIYVTFKCDIDLQPAYNVSNSTSLPQGDNYAKLFWNPCINVEVMAWTNPNWCMHPRTHLCTHTHTPNKNCNSHVSLYCKWARQKLYVDDHLSTSYFFNLIIWEKMVPSMHWSTRRPHCFFNNGGMF